MVFEPLKSIGKLEAKLYKSLLNIGSGVQSDHRSFFSFMDSYGSDTIRCSDEDVGIKFRESCAKELFGKCVHHLVSTLTQLRVYGISSNLLT